MNPLTVCDPSRPDLRMRYGWREVKSAAVMALAGVAVLATALPLLAVVAALIGHGATVAFRDFPAFFVAEIPVVTRRAGPGMGPAIAGTILTTTLASLIAVPLGVLGAIYLHEYGGTRTLARLVRFLSHVMTGVPSIVMGLFVYVAWTLHFGYSALGGALALACLMLPMVIGGTEQIVRLVPPALREAAYALGASKSRTILTVVVPAALPGIVSSALLAVARAAGETAPLLFAVGAATSFNWNGFAEANTALPLQIFANATSSFSNAQERAWGAALTLVLVTFIATLTARRLTARFGRK